MPHKRTKAHTFTSCAPQRTLRQGNARNFSRRPPDTDDGTKPTSLQAKQNCDPCHPRTTLHEFASFSVAENMPSSRPLKTCKRCMRSLPRGVFETKQYCPGCRSRNTTTHARHVGRVARHAALHWAFSTKKPNLALIEAHLRHLEQCKWLADDAANFPIVACPIDEDQPMSTLNFMLIEKRCVHQNVSKAQRICARLVARRVAMLLTQ